MSESREAREIRIGSLLRMPAEAVMRQLLAEASAAGFTDLVPAHFTVLRYPGPEGRRPSDLAAEAGVTRQAMNYVLRQLEELGYVVREAHAEDLRGKHIHLTERGEALVEILRESAAIFENELKEELGSASYDRLHDLLLELNATKLVARTWGYGY